jgi:hypothetical protein
LAPSILKVPALVVTVKTKAKSPYVLEEIVPWSVHWKGIVNRMVALDPALMLLGE